MSSMHNESDYGIIWSLNQKGFNQTDIQRNNVSYQAAVFPWEDRPAVGPPESPAVELSTAVT